MNLTYLVKPTSQKPVLSKPTNTVANTANSLSANESCGVSQIKFGTRSLVFGGEIIQRGEWPWLVAVYSPEPFGISFTCGGNLISAKAVLTAAHCIRTSTTKYQTRKVLLYFGQYKRLDWNEADSLRYHASNILIHPDYRRHQQRKDADIAMILTDELIKFNDFIQPICLWTESDDGEWNIKKGTVVGWGKDSLEQMASTYPRKIELPIVDPKQCIQRSVAIAPALSNRTFCAGTLNGEGPCHGDSGK